MGSWLWSFSRCFSLRPLGLLPNVRKLRLPTTADESTSVLSVATQASTAVIGRSGAASDVEVFVRSPSGWASMQVIPSPTAQIPSDFFGASLALAGDRLFVGDTSNSTTAQGAGAVHVLRRNVLGFAFDERLESTGPQPFAEFGALVTASSDGQRFVTLERKHDTPTLQDVAVVHVYTTAGPALQHIARLVPQEVTPLLPIGRPDDLAIDGEYLAVSGYPGATGGVVQLWRESAGTYLLETTLAPDPVDPLAPRRRFGSAIDIDDGRVAVAAMPEAGVVGTVEVFEEFVGGWLQADLLIAPSEALGGSEQFGAWLDLTDDVLLVGDPGSDLAGQNAGAIHVYVDRGSGFQLSRTLTAADAQSEDRFGLRAAVMDDRLLVIEPNFDFPAAYGGGGAWAFEDASSCPMAPLGTSLCSAVSPNSTGQFGAVELRGSEHVSDGLLGAHAWNLPPGSFTYLGASRSVGSFPLGQGVLCLGAPLVRPLGGVMQVDSSGRVRFQVDLRALPGGGGIQSGETWGFQVVHRDRAAVRTANTTEARQVLFL